MINHGLHNAQRPQVDVQAVVMCFDHRRRVQVRRRRCADLFVMIIQRVTE